MSIRAQVDSEVPPLQTSRIDFFKPTVVVRVAASVFGFDLRSAYAQLRESKFPRANETRSAITEMVSK
jgi:hypothetical protein